VSTLGTGPSAALAGRARDLASPRDDGEAGPGRTQRTRLRPGLGMTLLRRVIRLVVSLVVVLSLSFFLLQLVPGNPARTALGPDASAGQVAQLARQLGLDNSLLVQYLTYWRHVFTGNFGTSIISFQPVSEIVESGLKNTAILVATALVVTLVASVVVGVVMGVLTHNNRHPRSLVLFTVVAGLVGAVPEFVVAVLLVYVFAVRLHWLPVAFASGWRSFVLPAASITGAASALMSRVVRAQTDAVLGQEYIRVARSKRLPNLLVYRRHALPNVLTAVLTLSGLQLGAIVAATIVIENIFAIPGLGAALVRGLVNRDYPVVQAILLIYAASILVLTLLVDVAISIIDPRSTVHDG
jgi:peptide/nickel transport system permease protein